MTRYFRQWILPFCIAAICTLAICEQRGSSAPTQRGSTDQNQTPDVKLPNGKSQRDEILKLEREENIKDAARLVEMSEELKSDLEKNDRFVLSIPTIKKTDEIEKLVKKIRSRLQH